MKQIRPKKYIFDVNGKSQVAVDCVFHDVKKTDNNTFTYRPRDIEIEIESICGSELDPTITKDPFEDMNQALEVIDFLITSSSSGDQKKLKFVFEAAKNFVQQASRLDATLLKTQLQELDVRRKEADVAAERDKTKRANRVINHLKTNLNAISKRSKQANQRIDILNTDVAAERDKTKRANRVINHLKTNLNAISKRSKKANQRTDILKTDLKRANRIINHLKTILNAISKRSKQANQRIDILNTDVAAERDKTKRANRVINHLKTNLTTEGVTWKLIVQVMARLSKPALSPTAFAALIRANSSKKVLGVLNNIDVPVEDIFPLAGTARPIHLAFYYGCRAVIDKQDAAELIKHTKKGFPPILFAAANQLTQSDWGYLITLSGGTLLKEYSTDGYTAAHIAAMYGNRECLQNLPPEMLSQERNGNIRPIHEVRKVELLDILTDTTPTTSVGWSLVHFAAQRGNRLILEYFKENRRSIALRVTDGSNIAHIAAIFSQNGILSWIKTNEAQLLQEKNNSGKKPYQVANGEARHWFECNTKLPLLDRLSYNWW